MPVRIGSPWEVFCKVFAIHTTVSRPVKIVEISLGFPSQPPSIARYLG